MYPPPFQNQYFPKRENHVGRKNYCLAVQVTNNAVILSQRQRVEGSSHFVYSCSEIGAKIPRRGFALLGMTAFSLTNINYNLFCRELKKW